MTLWDRGKKVDEEVLRFSAGNEYLLDRHLVVYDCRASRAHAVMLGEIGVLGDDEVESLVRGLREIEELHLRDEFEIRPEQEDCHTAIEEWLTEKLGDVGKKIHLGRSRNDQVLAAMRLLEMDLLGDVREEVEALREALDEAAEQLGEIELPGYTHMRRAMPTDAGTWMEAFRDGLEDDLALIDAVAGLVDRSPLGTGAGYGIPVFELDRGLTAREAGFAEVLENPIHAQMTRGKLEGAVLHALGQVMLTLNRLASDLILFSTSEFGFVSLPADMTTGSSIMPQKRNPDVLELVRAKYHVVRAAETQVMGLVGNLMSGYQRDLGLTKEPVIAAFDATLDCLRMMRGIVTDFRMDPDACADAMTGEVHATADAYRLVEEGMPFRDAYREVAKRYAEEE
jgi:argininosuccinate lyase